MTRGMKYGPESSELLETARNRTPKIAVYVLKGQNFLYTPEAFGGNT